MTTLNLHPKTRTVAAARIKPGDIVLESHEHPARITRVAVNRNGYSIWARYIWQPKTEKEWLLGVFRARSPIQKTVR